MPAAWRKKNRRKSGCDGGDSGDSSGIISRRKEENTKIAACTRKKYE